MHDYRRLPLLPPEFHGRDMTTTVTSSRVRNGRRLAKAARLEAVRGYASGKVPDGSHLRAPLRAIVRVGNRVVLERDNQKQADFPSRTLAGRDPVTTGSW